jgi:hypothetical protein
VNGIWKTDWVSNKSKFPVFSEVVAKFRTSS